MNGDKMDPVLTVLSALSMGLTIADRAKTLLERHASGRVLTQQEASDIIKAAQDETEKLNKAWQES